MGTYTRSGNVYASAVGKLSATPPASLDSPFTVSVALDRSKRYASEQVLSVGQIVLGRVARIATQQAFVEIVAAAGGAGVDIGGGGGLALRETQSGVIRKEDVRAGASVQVEIYSSFRSGDVVLAKIISLGDSRRYFLSTADSELGVIHAISATSGKKMVPVNWKEMECPDTKVKEARKCAKPSDP